jgi:hypothetical protein
MASDPGAVDYAKLVAAIAAAINLPKYAVKNLVVQVSTTARRRLTSNFVWKVSFAVTASPAAVLGNTAAGNTGPSLMATALQTSLAATAFVTALSAKAGISASVSGVTATASSHAPTPRPAAAATKVDLSAKPLNGAVVNSSVVVLFALGWVSLAGGLLTALYVYAKPQGLPEGAHPTQSEYSNPPKQIPLATVRLKESLPSEKTNPLRFHGKPPTISSTNISIDL